MRLDRDSTPFFSFIYVSVGILTGQRVGRPRNRGFIPGKGVIFFLLSKTSRPTLRPTHPPVQWALWVKAAEAWSWLLTPSSTAAKNICRYTSFPPCSNLTPTRTTLPVYVVPPSRFSCRNRGGGYNLQCHGKVSSHLFSLRSFLGLIGVLLKLTLFWTWLYFIIVILNIHEEQVRCLLYVLA